MNSPAYRALSGDALKLMLDVWKRHDGTNNGDISYSVREAAELLHGNKNTAAKRFSELIEKGFLAVESKGAFHVKVRHATTWRITLEPCQGHPPTRDYQRWRPAATVSPAITVVTPKKQNTVSLRDHDGISGDYRASQNGTKTDATVSPAITVTPVNSLSTVSLASTHIDSTIPLATQDAMSIQREKEPSVSVEVLRNPLSSAARCPLGSERVRAPDDEPKVDLSSVLASRLAKREGKNAR